MKPSCLYDYLLHPKNKITLAVLNQIGFEDIFAHENDSCDFIVSKIIKNMEKHNVGEALILRLKLENYKSKSVPKGKLVI